jgi:hypothetical protein
MQLHSLTQLSHCKPHHQPFIIGKTHKNAETDSLYHSARLENLLRQRTWRKTKFRVVGRYSTSTFPPIRLVHFLEETLHSSPRRWRNSMLRFCRSSLVGSVAGAVKLAFFGGRSETPCMAKTKVTRLNRRRQCVRLSRRFNLNLPIDHHCEDPASGCLGVSRWGMV